ncbi:hypothetical protein HMPREF9962_0678 [Streptococcus parasanguinis SK236]|nr:hypothetical protein HMPREF9962_0678 [Streptococcus parasanguinis SK236]
MQRGLLIYFLEKSTKVGVRKNSKKFKEVEEVEKRTKT